MTDHRSSIDYLLGVDERQTTANVDALLAAVYLDHLDGKAESNGVDIREAAA